MGFKIVVDLKVPAGVSPEGLAEVVKELRKEANQTVPAVPKPVHSGSFLDEANLMKAQPATQAKN